MPSHVRFSEDTKVADSPHKGFINKANETNATEDLAHDRGELRFNMHGKITIVEYSEFVELFLPPSNDTDEIAHENIFENIDRPKGEPDMYKELVSLFLRRS